MRLPATPTPDAAVIGRERELELITEFLHEASEAGGALLLLGELGVGKTALLDATGDLAKQDGFHVLRISGVEFESDVNYSGLNQALLALSDHLPRLSSVYREALSVALGLGSGEPPDQMLVSNAALALFALAAAEQPVLLLADDVHWLDRASAWVLMFLARRIEGNGIAFVAATRPGAESFFEGAGLEEIELQPLSDDAARQLLVLVYPDLAPTVHEHLVAEAQGNPLALIELPAVLSSRQGGSDHLPTALPLSRRLHTEFSGRISSLPRSCMLLLVLTALDGTGDLSLLQRANGEGTLDDLAPAERAGLITIEHSSRTVRFRHPLVRTALIGSSTRQELEDAHRQLANLLVDAPDRRARHLAEATVEPDADVALLLEEAAQAMQSRGDPLGAASMLIRAADLSPEDAEKGRRLSKAAYLGASNELRDVAQLLEDAGRADPQLNTSLHFASAAAYMILNGEGDVDTAHRLLDSAINSQTGHIGTNEANRAALKNAIDTFGYMCYLGVLPRLWESFHAALARLGPEVGDEFFLYERVYADPLRASQAELAALEKAVDSLQTESDQFKIVQVSGMAASVNRTVGCRDGLWRVVGDGRRGQAPGPAAAALAMLCDDDVQSGRWDEVEPLVTEGLTLCETHAFPMGEWVLRYHLALVAAGRGEHESVRQLTESINNWAAPRSVRLAQNGSNLARELDALGEGNFEYAYQLATAISPAGTIPPYSLHALWVSMDLVESALRTNRREEALAHVEVMQSSHMERISSRLALLVMGAAAMVHSGDDTAADLYLAALNSPGASRWTFQYARVQLALGEHLRRTRANVSARPYLEAALEAFDRLGARPWSRRANRELRATRQSRPTKGYVANVDLTPQERQIAILAASGLTNKEMGTRLNMSHRTVGSHLYHMYPKLGVTSRGALRDAIARLDLEDVDDPDVGPAL
jgi:DNA-binding CsgD family transcriptional regulator